MGRPFAPSHVLTLVLTALLAWPWNVVLSAAESLQIATLDRAETVPVQAQPKVQRVTRHGRCHPPSCSVMSPDYDCDEEEGDGGGPFSPPSAFSPVPVLPRDLPTIPARTHPSPPDKTVFRQHICNLRC